MSEAVRYVSAEARTTDDFNGIFTREPGEVVYDAKTVTGQWACMNEDSFHMHTYLELGVGKGQKYVRQENGELHKVEG